MPAGFFLVFVIGLSYSQSSSFKPLLSGGEMPKTASNLIPAPPEPLVFYKDRGPLTQKDLEELRQTATLCEAQTRLDGKITPELIRLIFDA
ncbi:MAG: hypothetical protein WCT08_03940 [Patescibacteria group bacterium]